MDIQLINLIRVYSVLIQTLGEEGIEGIPSGHAYMAYMQLGLSLDQFQSMLNRLEANKYIQVRNHFITKGKDFHILLAVCNRISPSKALNG